jgi:hypothetical protein
MDDGLRYRQGTNRSFGCTTEVVVWLGRLLYRCGRPSVVVQDPPLMREAFYLTFDGYHQWCSFGWRNLQ